MRILTTVEKTGTKIRHITVGTLAEITGTVPGGFQVKSNSQLFKLSFNQVENWEVL